MTGTFHSRTKQRVILLTGATKLFMNDVTHGSSSSSSSKSSSVRAQIGGGAEIYFQGEVLALQGSVISHPKTNDNDDDV